MTKTAFDSYYREHYTLVLRFAERRIDQELALEVCADCFAIAWRDFDDDSPPPLPWLYQTARNLLGNAYRKRAREQKLLDALVERARTVDDRPSQTALSVAIDALKPKDRDALQLTYWEGLGAADVATVLGCTEQAAWKRLSRAKQQLRVLLETASDTIGKEDANV